ncbi:ABC transporter ATP-binding protein [uncultured Veillonella sp.]|uniref:ABC transporter ATP-binding protein n=1 Tax=uncultured Veillonella sp. TaxID=159268 RepID=UPI00262A4E40|nr:ABC transporter ATP-binding protein [uncultured Veillonella sp.]
MYQINQLSFSYEKKEVLKNISVTFPNNKITAIIGPNGCGKSTLLSHLYRLLPSKDKITLNQKPLESYKGREFAQLVAVLTQSRDSMIDDFLVKDIVLMGRYPYKQHFGTYSADDVKIAEHYMNEVGITHLADEQIHHLSGGEKQRVFIAKALTQKPQILLLDEPTNHLDMKTKDILKQALLDFDGTLIVVSHDRDFLDGLVSKVYEFGNQKVTEHLEGIYEFMQRKKMENLRELERKN